MGIIAWSASPDDIRSRQASDQPAEFQPGQYGQCGRFIQWGGPEQFIQVTWIGSDDFQHLSFTVIESQFARDVDWWGCPDLHRFHQWSQFLEDVVDAGDQPGTIS